MEPAPPRSPAAVPPVRTWGKTLRIGALSPAGRALRPRGAAGRPRVVA